MIAALLFVAALAAEPAAVPPETAVSTPASPSPIADTDLREFIAIAGRKVAGRPVEGHYATADKVLLIRRDQKSL